MKNAGCALFQKVHLIQSILCHNSPKWVRTIIVPNTFRLIAYGFD